MSKITKSIQKIRNREQEKMEQQKSKEKQTGLKEQSSILVKQSKGVKLSLQKDKRNKRLKTGMSTQRLREIQSQKELVKMQLKQINQKIHQIKQQEQSHSILSIRQQIANNIQAKKMAINLVKHYRQRKKQFQQKKRRFQQKLRSNLVKECQQERIKRQILEQALLQQKRNVISMRMYQSKKKRQQRQQIQKESNSLVKQLLKEDSKVHLNSKQKLIGNSRYQLKVVQRKPDIDFLQIQKHQSQYLLHKQKQLTKKQRSISISYPIKTYHKNRWACKIQEVQMKQRQAQQLKKIQKQNLLERKIKYGQLIHSLFVQKKIKRQKSQQKIHKSQSMGNEDIKKNSSKAFLGKQNYLNKTQQIKEVSPQNKLQQQSSSRLQQQLRRKHLMSLKKQTIKRLVNIQLFKAKRKVLEPSKYQSKYNNYLGKVNIKKRKQSAVWNQIMNNKKLTQQQKNASILQKAIALQNKAKLKQSLKLQQDKVVSLYLDSIQAKLVILQNM